MASCSFNKLFLQPTTIPAAAKGMTVRTKKDTTLVTFSKGLHQPAFLKNGKDTIDLGYSIESVVYKNSNGDTLNGWFLKPKGAPAAITVLHLHGNAGCVVSQYGAISPLLNYGMQVFVFDYSGFGFSGGKATKKNVLVDALSTLDYLKTREDVKNTSLVLYGQSLGGHLSAVVAAKHQNDIDALVVEGAFSSHRDIAAYMVPVLGRLMVKKDYSAKESIATFHKPVLIIHSTDDETIPFKMGQKLFAVANTPKEFYEIKHCHICGPNYYPAEISEKIKTMLSGK